MNKARSDEESTCLRAQLAKYKEALEWYGDESQYERNVIEHEDENGKTTVWYSVIIDRGQRAREAVGK